MLSIKFFDEHLKPSTAEVLEFAFRHPDVGLEVSNYRGTDFASVAGRLAELPAAQKSIHLNHGAYALGGIGRGEPAALSTFAKEMEFVDRMGIAAGAVMHICRNDEVDYRFDTRVGRKLPCRTYPDVNFVVDAVYRAIETSGSHGHLFVENVFEPLAFFREIFDAFDRGGNPGQAIGFCLDIGHARVLSDDSLREWLEFSEGLATRGYPIHAHVHCNRGVADDHMPLIEGEREGLLGPVDGFSTGLIEESVRLFEIVADEHFVFETDMPECIDNVLWFCETALKMAIAA